jgi:hypothetical protein
MKDPMYYLRVIRHHFIGMKDSMKEGLASSKDQVLTLQALGLGCQNLVYVACLVQMKGYATYKRIKNDSLSLPVAESESGRHLGLVKKVRLTVKLQRAANFDEIIAKEEEAERLAKKM